MTPDQQTAADLRQQGHTRAQIARAMGKSETAVKSLLRRAKKWAEADPAAKRAATVAGSNAIPHSFWVKTDSHSVYFKTPQDAPASDLLAEIAEAMRDVPAYRPNPIAATNDGLMTVYPLYDMHIGMLAWGRETRGQDYDLDLMKSDLIAAIERIARKSPKSNECLIILGGDTLHVNDHFNETPASKHKQDADGRFEKIIDVAIEAIVAAIEIACDHHHKVNLIILRGNHDETSHIVLKAALKQRYRLSDAIKFPTLKEWDKSEIYWFRHGKSLIVAHHGDKIPPDKLAMIAADKCEHWTECKYRVVLTGHRHTLRVQDYIGFTHYSLRAFAPPDAYGASFGGVRGLQSMSFSDRFGLDNIAFDPIER